MRSRLAIWDDDESDEMFYVDRYAIFVNVELRSIYKAPHLIFLIRARWRHLRARRLEAEEAADAKSRRFEEQEAENLRRESEDFLARQMDEMQALADEQRKAGLLLDDGAPVRLTVSIAPPSAKEAGNKEKATVFGQEEEEEEGIKKRKVPLVKLDFSVAESGEKTRERVERTRLSVPHDKETLFKAKVRWDGLSDVSHPTLMLTNLP
jgi:RNA-binding protein 25